jgi:small GTP-binding protein
MEYSGK